MDTPERKSLLVVIRHSPYGSSLSRSAIDAALAGAAFEFPVGVLFMGDGVLNLLPNQNASAVGTRNIAKVLASLPLYGIDTVYADAEAASRHGIDLYAASVKTVPLDADGICRLMGENKHLLGF